MHRWGHELRTARAAIIRRNPEDQLASVSLALQKEKRFGTGTSEEVAISGSREASRLLVSDGLTVKTLLEFRSSSDFHLADVSRFLRPPHAVDHPDAFNLLTSLQGAVYLETADRSGELKHPTLPTYA